MAQLQHEFNVNDVGERKGFDPIPAGVYSALILENEIKPTKNDGEMLVYTLEVQEGQYQGRKLYERLNIKNNSSDAQKIAYETLGEMVRACGLEKIRDTDELNGRRVSVTVKVAPARPYVKDGAQHPGMPQNEITKYLPLGVAHATAQTSESAPVSQVANAPAVASSASSLPPWKR